MKLLHLAVDNLLYLFNQKFTLQELLSLRGLFRPLCDLIESPHCIGRRRALKLFWSFDDVCLYPGLLFRLGLENVRELRLKPRGQDDDDLIVWREDCFGLEASEMLIRLMPNVTHLVVYFGRTTFESNYETVLEVIECWSARVPLTGLSLFGLFESDKLSQLRTQFPAQLVQSINRLWRHLTVLDLRVDGLFCNGHQEDTGTEFATMLQDVSTFQPELLQRLRRLYFVNSNAVKLIKRFPSSPASDCCLTQLGYDYAFEPPGENYSALRALSATGQLTHLRFAGNLEYLSSLVNYIPRIESLQVVRIMENESLVQALVPQLIQLAHLTHLTLYWFDFSVFEREPVETHYRYPVLARISSLKLVHSHIHSKPTWNRLKCPNTFFRTIARIFPNISRLTLRLGYVFHDEANRTVPIDPSIHLSHFHKLTRFRYTVLLGLEDTYHHLLSGHHQARYRREMAAQHKWLTMRHIKLGYNGVQLWVRSGPGEVTWREAHPAECIPQ